MKEKIDRADKVLVALGHFESRAGAQAAIAAGRVYVGARALKKASEKIRLNAKIHAEPEHPWVSRGGMKLAHALDVFDVSVAGRACLDIGSSTGGFTDVLLSKGASKVIAVDVGRGQLHSRLRTDQRVISMEETDARSLTAEQVRGVDLIVCDASFISLSKLLGVPLSLMPPDADLITLFKPQFEVGRENIGKGGIVTDKTATNRAEANFVEWLSLQGWPVSGRVDSPITGADGNQERLIWAIRITSQSPSKSFSDTI
ncbi:MAG: TlyA family RNA methyltransferase [Pseudomonadota bacterium]